MYKIKEGSKSRGINAGNIFSR